MMTNQGLIASVEQIESQIFLIRGQKVMLDEDLAALYEVETKVLNRAVKRNFERFLEDFMFQLSADEFANLRFQSDTSSLRSQIGTSRWGGRRYPPYAFTEQGVSMLSSVLRSSRAIQVNIEIMRAFVRLRQMLTLVLVPSLGLLSQLLREWTFAAATPFEVLCVCSDQTVGSNGYGKTRHARSPHPNLPPRAGEGVNEPLRGPHSNGYDEAIHSVADLAFPVTSDVDEVKSFLSGAGNRVVFSTYQSSSVITAAQADSAIPAFDLAVADEAHRCAGKVGSDFTAILDDGQIRSKKRLFATATPRTYSSTVHKAAADRGVEVVGMDNAALFGEVLYALPFGKAIERKLLTDYRVVIIGVDDPTIAGWIANRELVSTGTGIETDSESLAAQIGLLKAIKDYDLKRIINHRCCREIGDPVADGYCRNSCARQAARRVSWRSSRPHHRCRCACLWLPLATRDANICRSRAVKIWKGCW